MTITNDILYVGVNDHQIDLFEGQYEVPLGMAYNSYVIRDEKTVVMDTVDGSFAEEWMNNIKAVLGDKAPDYLVIQHMEPDHSGSIAPFMAANPETVIVASAKAFAFMKQFVGTDYPERQIVIKEGSVLELGRHTLNFVAAPMVHWPEVMMTYDSCDKVLFSADGFGKFGANDVEDPEGWDCEARRYYFGIVGKYGAPVQTVLKKAAGLDIQIICPLHGPVLTEDLGHYLEKYDIWSSYRPENQGVTIAYTTVYGNTRKAVMMLAEKLRARGVKVSVHDLARDDNPEAMEDAFRYDRLVLATTTYNAGIFPWMDNFVNMLVEHGYQSRKIALIENGTWAPMAAKVMRKKLEFCKDLTFCENVVTLRSAMDAGTEFQINALVEELAD